MRIQPPLAICASGVGDHHHHRLDGPGFAPHHAAPMKRTSVKRRRCPLPTRQRGGGGVGGSVSSSSSSSSSTARSTGLRTTARPVGARKGVSATRSVPGTTRDFRIKTASRVKAHRHVLSALNTLESGKDRGLARQVTSTKPAVVIKAKKELEKAVGPKATERHANNAGANPSGGGGGAAAPLADKKAKAYPRNLFGAGGGGSGSRAVSGPAKVAAAGGASDGDGGGSALRSLSTNVGVGGNGGVMRSMSAPADYSPTRAAGGGGGGGSAAAAAAVGNTGTGIASGGRGAFGAGAPAAAVPAAATGLGRGAGGGGAAAAAAAAGPPAGSAAAKRAAANAMRPLRGDDAALNLRDPAGQLLARDPRPLNSGATCDVWGYTYPEGTAMAGTRVAVKRIQHGRLPHQCRNNREDLAHLVKAMVPEGGLIPTEVTNAGSQETALIMEIGLDMGPGAGDTPMPVVERAGGLRAMARCARWLAVNNLGYIDFKLENMVAVNGVARCVDLVENVGDQRRAGSIHTFRMYRLIGRKARPVAEPVNCAAVKANEETMLYMMACTLLQMVACDVLVESEGPKESEIFAKGIPAGVHFTESEAVLLNFAFFDPQIRRQMKCAQFEQMVFDASKSTTADCWWNPQTKMVEKMP